MWQHRISRLVPLVGVTATALAVGGCDRKIGEEHRALVGRQFAVSGPLLAFGIREHGAAPLKYVTLMPPPGIAGKSVVPLGQIKLGSHVVISEVRITERVVDDPVQYTVLLENAALPQGLPIYVDRFRGNEDPSGRWSLNPEIFKPVPQRE